MLGSAVDLGRHGLRGTVASLEPTTMPIALTVCSSVLTFTCLIFVVRNAPGTGRSGICSLHGNQ